HDEGQVRNACDRRNVSNEIEGELVIECRVDRVDCTRNKQRVTFRGRPNDDLSADICGRSWTVLNDEWLAEALRQPLAQETRDNISRPSGRSRHDDVHWPRRIRLRPRETR